MDKDRNFDHPEISAERVEDWQSTIDLLAEVADVPAALVMRVHPKEIEVLVSSHTDGNPYSPGDSEGLRGELYCETVIADQALLHVPNALKDPVWDHNPDIKLNMISYLGLPLTWPDGEPFGTICVLDSKERDFSGMTEAVMSKFASLINSELGLEQQLETIRLSNENLEQQVEVRTAELRKQIDRLRRLEALAAEANHTKSQFLANVSHELRTPLNAILGFSEMIKMQLYGAIGSDRYRQCAVDIHDASSYLLTLINDLLDVSRIEMGALQLEEEPFDINDILSQSWRLLERMAYERDIRVSWNACADAPDVIGDDRRIRQVFLNILSNALKFTPPGGEVHVRSYMGSGELAIEITDTGSGISDIDIPTVLKPFGQLGDVMTRDHEGAGLGLPLAKAFMEMHGGALMFANMPQGGTRVTMTIPAKRLVAA